MATDLAININKNLDDNTDHDIYSVFKEPSVDTTIIRTTSVRGEIAEPIDRNTREIIIRFPASTSNTFNKINSISYNINFKLELLDLSSNTWTGYNNMHF